MPATRSSTRKNKAQDEDESNIAMRLRSQDPNKRNTLNRHTELHDSLNFIDYPSDEDFCPTHEKPLLSERQKTKIAKRRAREQERWEEQRKAREAEKAAEATEEKVAKDADGSESPLSVLGSAR